MSVYLGGPPHAPHAPPNAKPSSQDNLDKFWKSLSKPTGGARTSSVLPLSFTADKLPKPLSSRTAQSENAVKSYEAAVEACKAKVAKIVKECRRVNQKYLDPHFDLDNYRDTIYSLCAPEKEPSEDDVPPSQPVVLPFGRNDRATLIGQIFLPPDKEETSGVPQSVKRVGDIFDDPSFYVDGTSAKDIRQGLDGDCWFLSSLAALCTSNSRQLIEDVCVARDEAVGVYGFVFHRDGEWISEIIDDKLFLKKPDYDDSEGAERQLWEDSRIRVNSEEEYRRVYQANSGALWYAQCASDNETWVPLIEKAYAKAHGDYEAIEGGWTGEGIEDLTGGIATRVKTTDILDKDKFWKDGLMKVGKEYLFGCETGFHRNTSDDSRQGLFDTHAYSILDAKDIDGHRLLKVKNPWGKTEWTGPWSDGSSEWTAEWINKLGHSFGDDGIFWISYKDLLRKYRFIHQTRIFDKSWNVARLWTNVQVPWAGDYSDSKFEFTLSKTTSTVIVLSQLDSRYFRGLEGQYDFKLSFRVHEKGEEDYLVRTISDQWFRRSTSVELELEAGTYIVAIKLEARRDEDKGKIEDVVSGNWLNRREKLLAVGLSYDTAHAKGRFEEDKTTKPEVESRGRSQSRKNEKSESKERHTRKPAGKKPNKGLSHHKDEAKKVEASHEETKTGLDTTEEKPVGSAETEDLKPAVPDAPTLDEAGAEAHAKAKKEDEIEKDEDEDEDEDEDYQPSEVSDDSSEHSTESDDSDSSSDEEETDPWDANCVVGLRVYAKEADVTITYINTKKGANGEQGDDSLKAEVEALKGDEPQTAEEKGLDVDHPVKDEVEGN